MKCFAILICLALLASGLDAAEPAKREVLRTRKDNPLVLHLLTGSPFYRKFPFSHEPISYGAEGLPAGLTLDAWTGVVFGTPLSAGRSDAVITARNNGGTGKLYVRFQIAEQENGDQPSATVAHKSSGAASEEDEEDEPDVYLEKNAKVAPWTDNMRRTVENNLLPAANTLPAHDWYYRVIHIGREPMDRDWNTNFFGLDDNVKIGILLGYGLAENWDITFQRTNGYTLQVDLTASEPTRFDYYDLMLRHKFLDQYDGLMGWGGLADVSLSVGITDMQRNQGISLIAFNALLMAERDFLNDRLRLGTGLVYSSLSAYERTIGFGPDTKLMPDEFDELEKLGIAPEEEPEKSTTAVPLVVVVALSKGFQLFGEAIVPIAGYETGAGPTICAGFRLNTNSHQYNFHFSNSGNTSVNSVITGGHSDTSINLFGFNITAYF